LAVRASVLVRSGHTVGHDERVLFAFAVKSDCDFLKDRSTVGIFEILATAFDDVANKRIVTLDA
jgi:hypothetical protein